MATEKPPEAVTLSPDTVTTLVTGLATIISTAKDSGSKLADFAALASKAKLPAVVSNADVDAIADALSVKMGWAGTPRERQSKSEARAIIRSHAALPEGLAAYKTATGSCGYHDAVKVARKLAGNGGNVGNAISELTADNPKGKADPMVKLQRALQSFRNSMADGKRKNKAALIAACDTFASAAGVKLKTE